MRILYCILFYCLSTVVTQAQDLTVVTFNTESDGDTSPGLVAQQIRQLGDLDVLAVQEVESDSALFSYTKALAEQLGGKWRYVISESGTNRTREDDLLGIIYNTDDFRHLATTELHMVRSEDGSGTYGDTRWSLRGILIVRLLHYASDTEFQIATMHFKCCGAPEVRAHQTALLAAELKKLDIPTILLGDSNIPLEVDGSAMSSANQVAFDNLTTHADLSWAKPVNPISTQCNPSFNSMLDQVYVPAAAADSTTATILFDEADYCDGDAGGFADHRPIRAVLSDFLTSSGAGAGPAAAVTGAATLDPDDIEERSLRFDRPGDVLAE